MHSSNSGCETGLTLSEPRRNINPKREVRYPPGENTGVISLVTSSRIIYTTSAEVHLQPQEEHQSNSTNLEQTQVDHSFTRIITPPDFHQTISTCRIEEDTRVASHSSPSRMSFVSSVHNHSDQEEESIHEQD